MRSRPTILANIFRLSPWDATLTRRPIQVMSKALSWMHWDYWYVLTIANKANSRGATSNYVVTYPSTSGPVYCQDMAYLVQRAKPCNLDWRCFIRIGSKPILLSNFRSKINKSLVDILQITLKHCWRNWYMAYINEIDIRIIFIIANHLTESLHYYDKIIQYIIEIYILVESFNISIITLWR